MTELLPLFPLGSVLFPGLVLPLHIFEQRYRDLVADLLAGPEDAPRRFGVVAIREGHEVGETAARALRPVGCSAELVEAEQLEDGRYALVTTGGRRFVLGDLDHSKSYLQAQVEWLPDEVGDADEAAILSTSVGRTFRTYLQVLGRAHGGEVEMPSELPDDPTVLSYLVAATTVLDVATRQELLEAPDAGQRLHQELALLRRETALLRALATAPAPDFGRSRISPN